MYVTALIESLNFYVSRMTAAFKYYVFRFSCCLSDVQLLHHFFSPGRGGSRGAEKVYFKNS